MVQEPMHDRRYLSVELRAMGPPQWTPQVYINTFSRRLRNTTWTPSTTTTPTTPQHLVASCSPYVMAKYTVTRGIMQIRNYRRLYYIKAHTLTHIDKSLFAPYIISLISKGASRQSFIWRRYIWKAICIHAWSHIRSSYDTHSLARTIIPLTELVLTQTREHAQFDHNLQTEKWTI